MDHKFFAISEQNWAWEIITTGIKKLIQSGKVVKVTSNVSVDSQWQATIAIADSGMTNITSADSVATTKGALKAIGRRSIGAKQLWKLNHEQIKSI